jgi:hypothetical protein
MPNKFKEPIDIKEICRMIDACENEDDLDEVWDLIYNLGQFNKISASQYIDLTTRFEEKLEDITL